LAETPTCLQNRDAASDNTKADGSTPEKLLPADFKPNPSQYSLRIRLGEGVNGSGASAAEIPVVAVSAGNGFAQAADLTAPCMRTLEDFDWDFNRSIKRKQFFDLAAGAFVRQRRNALLVGPPGVGKSHCVRRSG
jgi:hypothetical protein